MQSIIEILIVFVGLAFTPLLFYRFPRLAKSRSTANLATLSVIIPARNEAENLPLLLEDLRNQSYKPFEIICVDDDSSDNTAEIAASSGVRVISLHNKPDGWIGKTWACQNGANAARGDLLLFLDADVRLAQNGMQRLMRTYSEHGCTISVQPYHKTETWYEQCSILFSLVQIAANGTLLPKPMGVGLHGPVILVSKTDYNKVEGHESVKNNIVDDLALGKRLRDSGIPYRLYVGDSDISYRMYSGGLRSLFQGWTKNILSGAANTPPLLLGMMFIWIASMTSVPIHAALFAGSENWPWFILYTTLYILWAAVLYVLSKQAGCFRLLPIALYPLLIIVFFIIFIASIVKGALGLKVVWKGRDVKGGNKSCK